MDFGIYPPEINSGRMYAGPGPGPMLAAAQAWEGLAEELYATAGSYQSVVSELTSGSWVGPSSAAMTAAAASYAAWLSTTAAQAEETAVQARVAVAAYEAAFMSTVPPPVVAANRSLLMTLVATNFFGQNTPAIAVTEAQYAEMWAQDAAAMYGYAGSSASATVLTPFTSPRQNTDPGGTANQAAAVGQATSTSAGNAQSVVSGVPQTFSAVPNALQGLAVAAPAASSISPSTLLDLTSDLIAIFVTAPASAVSIAATPLTVTAIYPNFGSLYVQMHTDPVVDIVIDQTSGSEAALVVPTPSVSGGLGEAKTVGALSVPRGWTVEAPALRPLALITPAGDTPTAAEPAEVGSGNIFSQLGLAGMLGSAMRGGAGTGAGQHDGERVAARVAANGDRAATDGEQETSHDNPRIVMTGVAIRIRELAKLRDEGTLTDEEFTEQKNRLLGR